MALPCMQELASITLDALDEAVLLRDWTAPATGEAVPSCQLP